MICLPRSRTGVLRVVSWPETVRDSSRMADFAAALVRNGREALVAVREIEQLQQGSMSNADRLEAAYRSYAAKQSGASKDEFLGLLLAGKVEIAAAETDTNSGADSVQTAGAS